jgi:hypothetical protein
MEWSSLALYRDPDITRYVWNEKIIISANIHFSASLRHAGLTRGPVLSCCFFELTLALAVGHRYAHAGTLMLD